MADELKLVSQFSDLPASLAAEAADVAPLSDGCPADTKDCETDGASCTSETCSDTCTDTCSDTCSDTSATAPTFTISSVTQTQATVKVTNPDRFYIRIFCRESGSTDAVIDEWVGNYTTYTGTIANLTPDTTYVVNVAYATGEGSADAQLVGAKTFTTEALPTGGASGVRIYNGKAWGAYQPYIYNGKTWKKYRAYIYNGKTWVAH